MVIPDTNPEEKVDNQNNQFIYIWIDILGFREELKTEDASGGKRKFTCKIVDTIESDEAKTIQKEIKSGEVYNSNALSLAARILENGASIGKVW